MKNYWYVLAQVSIGLTLLAFFNKASMEEIQLGYMVGIYALIMDIRNR